MDLSQQHFNKIISKNGNLLFRDKGICDKVTQIKEGIKK